MEALFCEGRASAEEERRGRLTSFRHDSALGYVEHLHHHGHVRHRRAAIVGSSGFDVQHGDPTDDKLVGSYRVRKGLEAAESQHIFGPPSAA